MGEEETIELEGYEIYRNDRNSDGGGVAIVVKEKIAKSISDIRKENLLEESIWIDIDGRKNYRIGVVYATRKQHKETRTGKDL